MFSLCFSDMLSAISNSTVDSTHTPLDPIPILFALQTCLRGRCSLCANERRSGSQACTPGAWCCWRLAQRATPSCRQGRRSACRQSVDSALPHCHASANGVRPQLFQHEGNLPSVRGLPTPCRQADALRSRDVHAGASQAPGEHLGKGSREATGHRDHAGGVR